MNKKLFLGLLALAAIFIVGCEATGQGGGTGKFSIKKPGPQTMIQRCFSDTDCRNTICPQVVGQDTPYCNMDSPNNKRCACGSGKIPASSGSFGGGSEGQMMGDGSAGSTGSGSGAGGQMAGSGSCKRICLQDMKKCQDGSLVGRDSCNNCQFEACPTSRAPPSNTAPPENTNSSNCPTDLKQCADGSFVVRNPEKNCAFNQCPTPSDTTTQRFHPADTDKDWEISLSEITSFVSLAIGGANLGEGYYKWELTPNGLGSWVMANGPPNTISDGRASRFHPADENRDWKVDIGEITKFVRLALKAEALFTGGALYKWNSQLQDWANP